ncbi:zinc knuckle (CCHC-type) family protein [Striga asiatica]|uniref:Zinc knuckle (CCHC-type) family protein n=1 Tax=Striga asiatica TaxID=4170 RepID=A0A5A7PUF6_STRAF|nr:zinc knuckle (CCHC-type) family protein [Striga asiatica]
MLYARLAVVLDIRKPLCASFAIRGKVQRVEYEFFPNICFHCGIYGHAVALCPDRSSSSAGEGESADGVAQRNGNRDTTGDAAGGSTKTAEDDGGNSSVYGPWIVAKTMNRPANGCSRGDKVVGLKQPVNGGGRGSRFDALWEHEREEHESVQGVEPTFTFGLEKSMLGSSSGASGPDKGKEEWRRFSGKSKK